jgi:protein SCO1/2
MTRTHATIAAAADAALVVGTAVILWRGASSDRFAACRESVIAGGAGAIGGPFTLVDTQGRTVTDRDVITRPSLVYFGYTFCPDVCPFDTARNAEAVDILEEMGHEVTPVFISVDPRRDAPAVLAEFVGNVHPRMIGLTGSEDQVRAAAAAYRVFYRAQPGDGDYYLVDHSTFTYLVLPDAGFVEFFRRDLTPEALAERVACFLDAR